MYIIKYLFFFSSAGGFNQPIMCGGEPRAMLRRDRGKADPPYYTIQICVPKHGNKMIFVFCMNKYCDSF